MWLFNKLPILSLNGNDTPAQRSSLGRRHHLLFSLLFLLTGCGFRPRRYFNLKERRLRFVIDRTSPLGQALHSLILNSGISWTDDPSHADATVVLSDLQESRDLLALSRHGTVREYALRVRFTVRLLDRHGNELLPPTPFVAERDYGYSDRAIFARAEEEQVLLDDLRRELFTRLLLLVDRRLANAPSP
ncbi:MAG: LPS assembly lipoprotein LptE [Hydrogenophilus sp.]|nr:LPS assembly lipoprotein LptE [Hydrogenophilus sp.]